MHVLLTRHVECLFTYILSAALPERHNWTAQPIRSLRQHRGVSGRNKKESDRDKERLKRERERILVCWDHAAMLPGPPPTFSILCSDWSLPVLKLTWSSLLAITLLQHAGRKWRCDITLSHCANSQLTQETGAKSILEPSYLPRTAKKHVHFLTPLGNSSSTVFIIASYPNTNYSLTVIHLQVIHIYRCSNVSQLSCVMSISICCDIHSTFNNTGPLLC